MKGANDSPDIVLRRLIVGYRLSQALAVAAKIGIADLLDDGPKSTEELARPTGTDAQCLYRVLRLLASEGVFAEDERGDFHLTDLAEPLRTDARGSLRARAIFDAEECNWRAWGNLLYSVRTGASAFSHTFGEPVFEYFKKHPAAAKSFDDVMSRQTASWSESIINAYDFSGLKKIVDVGGGYGSLLRAILEKYPALAGVLYELPHVGDKALSYLDVSGIAARCEIVSGDFFESIPAGGDAYILKHVLHDWDDEGCGRILKNCQRTMAGVGRLLVIEILIPKGNDPHYGKYLDLNMLVLAKGRERSEEEYSSLFAAAGFNVTRVIETSSELAIIEGVPG